MQSRYSSARRHREGSSWRDIGSEFDSKHTPTASAATDTTEVLVVGTERGRLYRYSDWLNEEYVTRIAFSDDVECEHVRELEPTVAVIDEQGGMERAGSALPDRARRWQTVILTDVEGGEIDADDCLYGPVGRDELLDTVTTARRVAAYDEVIEELLFLTTRRQTLRESLENRQVDRRRELGLVSARIDRLHEYINNELDDVESRYVELTDRGRQRPGHEDQARGNIS